MKHKFHTSLFSVAAMAMTIGSANAAAIIYEPFSQTAGSISGKAGGDGLNNWAVVSTASTVSTTPTLAYGQLEHTGGELVLPNGGGQTAYVTTTSALGAAGLLSDGATLWFSFVYSKASGSSSNERSGFAFGTDYLRTNSTTGAFMNGTGNGMGVSTFNNNILPATWSGGGASSTSPGTTFTPFGQTITIVGRIVWGAAAGNVETITIWSPDENNLPSDVAGLGAGFSRTMAGVDQTLFNTISVQQRNSGNTIIWDEFRFGASFSDVVVAIPEPSSALLGGIGMLMLFRRRR